METILTDGGGASPHGAADLIKETTTERFAADVLDASQEVPVIVDFWAPWCGPCKQLTPVLESVVTKAGGAVRLVKMNIDDHPEVAQQLRVQSIPAVFAFKNGQPVDGFMGALPESQVRAFVERLGGAIGPSAGEELTALGREAMEQGDLARAAQAFAQAVQEEPGNTAAIAGLARCYVEAGELDRARQTLGLTPPGKEGDSDIASAEAALSLAEKGAEAQSDLAPLKEAVAQNPDDHQARFDLALALGASGDKEGAADALLMIIENDREWNDEAARTQLLEFFEAWGPADEATRTGRRRLSSILFS